MNKQINCRNYDEAQKKAKELRNRGFYVIIDGNRLLVANIEKR